MNWSVYNELAWTETVLGDSDSYKEEAENYIQAMEQVLAMPLPTMLHLGCGAGGHDAYFKQSFQVTGVDISDGMLKIAAQINPEIEYIKGDMRTVRLNRKFDAVAVPDSIMYMSTLSDFSAAIQTAAEHLKPQGVMLVVTHTKEQYKDNSFSYTGEKDGTHITVLENNHAVSDSTYEAVMIHIIRRKKELKIHHEVHTLGIFPRERIIETFHEYRLAVREVLLEHLYDPYLLENGEYKLTMFIAAFTEEHHREME